MPPLRCAFLSLLPLLLVSCGRGGSTEASLPRLEHLRLAPVGSPDLPGITQEALTPRPEWHQRGRSINAETAPKGAGGELAFDEGAALPGGKGEDVFLEIPGPIDTRRFNRVAVRGIFEGQFELHLQLEGGPAAPFRPPALSTRNQSTPQTLVFDLGSQRGRRTPFEQMRILVRGPRRAFTLQGIDLISIPDHLTLPALDGPPAVVSIGPQARAAQGLPPSLPAECRFTVESAGEHLAFAAGIPPRLRPTGGAPEVVVELFDAGGEKLHGFQPFHLNLAGEGPQWREGDIALDPWIGRSLRAVFTYRCDAPYPGLAAVGDLRLWRRGEKAPLVLLISTDTLRADHLRTMDLGVEIDTPALDALASQGLLFTRAWSSTNVTSPSHVAMLTGIPPRDTRLVSNQDRLADEARTLGEVYHDAGWRTLFVASVRHLGPRGTDISQGFDRVFTPTAQPWRAEVAVHALESWLDDAQGLPVFAFLHLFDPHHPYEPPPAFDRRYYPADRNPFDPSGTPIPARKGSIPEAYWGKLTDVEFPKAQYRAEVSYVDATLAPLLERPRVASGLVAFTADHGEILEKRGSYFNHGELFPDTLHVPLILAGARLPESFHARRTALGARVLDVGRTLLDLSGLGGEDFPGNNLLAAVEAQAQVPLFSLSAHGLSASVEKDGWFLLFHLRDHQGTLAEPRHKGQMELFDLESDPECLHDLSQEQGERALALREELIAWLAAADPHGLSAQRTLATAEVAQLQALGYATEEAAVETNAWYEPD